MNRWPPPCLLPAADAESTFGLICIVLAALLLAGIALGFWPLRTWLGVDVGRRRYARRSTNEASGLLAVWCLYRHLERGAHFSVPHVPSVMVPGSIEENARDVRSASGSTTPLAGWNINGRECLVRIDN
jgi:hypothetical protein